METRAQRHHSRADRRRYRTTAILRGITGVSPVALPTRIPFIIVRQATPTPRQKSQRSSSNAQRNCTASHSPANRPGAGISHIPSYPRPASPPPNCPGARAPPASGASAIASCLLAVPRHRRLRLAQSAKLPSADATDREAAITLYSQYCEGTEYRIRQTTVMSSCTCELTKSPRSWQHLNVENISRCDTERHEWRLQHRLPPGHLIDITQAAPFLDDEDPPPTCLERLPRATPMRSLPRR